MLLANSIGHFPYGQPYRKGGSQCTELLCTEHASVLKQIWHFFSCNLDLPEIFFEVNFSSEANTLDPMNFISFENEIRINIMPILVASQNAF